MGEYEADHLSTLSLQRVHVGRVATHRCTSGVYYLRTRPIELTVSWLYMRLFSNRNHRPGVSVTTLRVISSSRSPLCNVAERWSELSISTQSTVGHSKACRWIHSCISISCTRLVQRPYASLPALPFVSLHDVNTCSPIENLGVPAYAHCKLLPHGIAVTRRQAVQPGGCKEPKEE